MSCIYEEPEHVHILINPKNSNFVCNYYFTDVVIYACTDILTDEIFHIKCQRSRVATAIKSHVDAELFISVNKCKWYQWGNGLNIKCAMLYGRARNTTQKNRKQLKKDYPEFFI